MPPVPGPEVRDLKSEADEAAVLDAEVAALPVSAVRMAVVRVLKVRSQLLREWWYPWEEQGRT